MKKAITLAMIVCVALTALSGLAYAGKAKHWICANCGKRVSKESMPHYRAAPRTALTRG